MDSALISIIVPVYKTPARYLQRFLRSALQQTLRDIQLIAVNDASPDLCPIILDAVAAQDERVSVVHRGTNGRAGLARSDGMGLVTGSYVLFADADDIMQPDMCERLYRLALEHRADIVACGWRTRDPQGKLLGRSLFPDKRYDLTSTRQRAQGYRSLNFALWNKVFRHEVIAPLRFAQFEANIGEDTLFNIEAFCRSRTFVTTAYVGYEYFRHAASATGRVSKGMPYLRTLAMSGERIRETLAAADGSAVGTRFSDRLALNRFTTGCGWIAEHPDPKERSRMWRYWRRHLRDGLLPTLRSRQHVATCYRLLAAISDASTFYRLSRIVARITDPMRIINRIKARLTFMREFASRKSPASVSVESSVSDRLSLARTNES